MCRRLLILVLLLPAAARADDRERFAELRTEYRSVAKSTSWADVKRRRELLREMTIVECPDSLPLLWEAFTSDRENLCRIPAMAGLARFGTTAVRKRLVAAALADRNDLFLIELPRVLAGCEDEELGEWLVRQLGRAKGPEARAVLVETLGTMRFQGASEPVRSLLAHPPPDVRLRREALLAIARIDGAGAVAAIEPFFADESPVVREAAILALGETGADGVVRQTFPLAADDSPRVREAVADLIGSSGDEAGLPVLVELLRSERLRVVHAARAVLTKMTGGNLGTDPEEWAAWLELRREGHLPEAKPTDADSAPTFYGLGVHSDRVLFLLDISGSMNAGRPPRIDTAREELTRTLGALTPATEFNVVAFSGSPMWWEDDLMPATSANVASARDFTNRRTAGGGTNVYDTLLTAFERNPEADTIFLLGDGCPSAGRVQDPEEILARIRWWNRLHGVRIHTIALPAGVPGVRPAESREEDAEEAARFLARLAVDSGGTFLRVGR